MKIGIFIKGNKELHKKISHWKKIIELNFKNSVYIDHLIHSTILVVNIKNNKHFIKDLENIKLKKINNLYIKKTEIFFNDPLTNKNTLVFLINKNKKLVRLQNFFIEKAQKYLIKSDIKNLKDTRFSNNLLKFGYPFVNKEWKPHFTIGSIDAPLNNEIYKNFKNQDIDLEFNIMNIQIYKIGKKSHKLLKEIPLYA